MSKRRIVNDGWQLSWMIPEEATGSGAGQSFPPSGAESPGPCTEPVFLSEHGPIPAQVPGDVHYDLYRNGLLPHPLQKDNLKLYEWVERTRFTYERTLYLDDRWVQPALRFGGIDLCATVYVNGRSVAESNNAHCSILVPLLRPHDPSPEDERGQQSDRKVTIRVEVESGVNWAGQFSLDQYEAIEPKERIVMRKPQYVLGWDWAPRLPTCGIWRGVELIDLADADIERIVLQSEVNPATAGAPTGSATVRASVSVRRGVVPDGPSSKTGGRAASVRATLIDRDGTPVTEVLGNIRSTGVPTGIPTDTPIAGEIPNVGDGTCELAFAVDRAELWYPRGYGEQPLYRLRFELLDEAGVQLTSKEQPYGFRRIELDQRLIEHTEQPMLPDDEERWFRFVVNGIPVFARGANWVPPEQFPGELTDERYDHFVREAADANMNMLRVWGGGMYESEAFYDACDRLGILVWQDFAFACAEYPEDDWFVKSVTREAAEHVPRLAKHPSLALLCGNNENQWIFGFYKRGSGGDMGAYSGAFFDDTLLPRLTAHLSPDVPYWPGSPFGGSFPNSDEVGDKHSWEVTNLNPDIWYKADYLNYRAERGRFISEYGLLSTALPQTIRDFSGQGSDTPLRCEGDAYRIHDNTFNREIHEGRDMTDYNLLVAFGSVPDDPEEYAERSLYYQAAGYREAISVHRTLPYCSGSLFWMFADCWGTHGWTVVDYYRRRKPSYYWVKKAYQPQAVFVRVVEKRAQTYVVNDTGAEQEFLISVECDNGNDQKRQRTSATVLVPPYERRLGPHIYDCFGWVRATSAVPVPGEEARIVSEDIVLTHHPRVIDVPDCRLQWDWSAEDDGGLLTIGTDKFALFVRIDHEAGATPEDNYFNLFPGQERCIWIEGTPDPPTAVTAMNQVKDSGGG